MLQHFVLDFSPVGMNPYQTDVATHRNSGLPVNFYFRQIQWYLLRTNGCSAGIWWLKLGVMPSNSWQAPGYQFITSSWRKLRIRDQPSESVTKNQRPRISDHIIRISDHISQISDHIGESATMNQRPRLNDYMLAMKFGRCFFF